MKPSRLLLHLSILLLIVFLAACGGKKESTSAPAGEGNAPQQPPAAAAQPTPVPPTATPTPVPPTPTPVPPTPTPEPQEELSGELSKIEEVVDSYRSKGEITYRVSGLPDTTNENVEVTMTFESAWTKADNPYGFDMVSRIQGLNADIQNQDNAQEIPSEMEIRMVGDTAYMRFGDKKDWMVMPRENAGGTETFNFTASDFLSGLEQMRKVGTETVNGIKTIHYTFEELKNYNTFLEDTIQSLAKEGESFDIKSIQGQVSGDLWVAKDGGYPVKFVTTMHIEAQIAVSVNGEEKTVPVVLDSKMSSEVYDVNADITIEAPAEAPQQGQVNVPGFEPGTFPIPDQTTLQGAFGGMITLISQLSPEDINAFYDQTLSKLGWSKQDGPMPVWSKGDLSFTLLVVPNDDGSTSITILSGGQ